MSLKNFDIDVYSILEKELTRQTEHLEMIASENFTLPEVMLKDIRAKGIMVDVNMLI